MIFLYSDAIKDTVQSKLAANSVDPAEVQEIFESHMKDLVDTYFDAEESQTKVRVKEEDRLAAVRQYVGLIYTYLDLVQRRFLRHYYAESLRLDLVSCAKEDAASVDILYRLKEISMLHRKGGTEGILSAFVGQEIDRYTPSMIRDPKKIDKLYRKGGTKESRNYIYSIFHEYFDLPLEQIDLVYKQQARELHGPTGTSFSFDSKVMALYCNYSNVKVRQGSGHAISFFTCGNRDYFFDDNTGTVEFPWRKFFGHLLDTKTEAMKRGELARTSIAPEGTQVGWLCCFDAILEIKSNREIVFQTENYPYMVRLKDEEYDGTRSSQKKLLLTYLGDGELIEYTQPMVGADVYTYTTTKKDRNGQDLTIELTLSPPTHILTSITQYRITKEESPVFTEERVNAKTGSILGSRFLGIEMKAYEVMFDRQLKKIKAGSAKIHDSFRIPGSSSNFTLLQLAIYINKLSLVLNAIEAGADVKKPLANEETPLFFAATNGRPTRLEIFKALLDAGADINDRSNSRGGLAALHGSIVYNEEDANLKHLEFLLSNGADVNLPSLRTNTTALEYAKFQRRYQATNVLIEYGAAPIVCPTKEELLKRTDGLTPIMKYIVEGQVVKAGVLARCYRDLELYTDLDYETKVGDTALKLAIHANSESLVQHLLDNGSDLNYVDRFGATPIHYAIHLNRVAIVKLLADSRANLGYSVKGLGTPLEYAIALDRSTLVQILLPLVKQMKEKKKYKEVKTITLRAKRKKLPSPPKTNYRFSKRPQLTQTRKKTPSN